MKFLIGLGVIVIVVIIFFFQEKLKLVWEILFKWIKLAMEKIKACLARPPDDQSGKGAD